MSILIKLRSPFSFWTVVGFALLLAFLIMAGRAAGDSSGMGAIIRAAIVGVADVDAITISLARLAPEKLDVTSATLAILAAVSTGMVSKIAIVATIGRGAFTWEDNGDGAGLSHYRRSRPVVCFVLGNCTSSLITDIEPAWRRSMAASRGV